MKRHAKSTCERREATQKTPSHKILRKGIAPTGGIKKTHRYQPNMVALREI